MVLIKGGDGHAYSWTEKGDPDEMRAGFTGWDPWCVHTNESKSGET